MSLDLGLLIVRVLFGAAIAAHGAQKLFGWFGGYGLKGTGGFFETIGFRPGLAFAAAAGLSEFGGGLLLVLGLFTPLGAAAVLSAMIVAAISVHLKNGFFVQNNGYEPAFLYGAAALALALTGAGAYSLDGELALSFFGLSSVKVALIVASLVGAGLTLASRRQPAAQPSIG
ncbi:MAG TPA: DoxX family protein [Pyrinomonadaceae bacterium]